MYSFKIASLNKENDTKVFKKAKGVTKCVTENSLSFDNYKKCLHDQQTFANEQTLLRSTNHKIGLYKQLKASLSPIDTKRYVLDNGIDTLAFGHYKIAEIKEAAHIASDALATQNLLKLSKQTLEESCKAVEIKDIISDTPTTDTAPQHLVCRVVLSLHTNHMQMSIVEVFICRRLHMNTSMIPVCIWLICRLCTALHTKCCGAVRKSYIISQSIFGRGCHYNYGRY